MCLTFILNKIKFQKNHCNLVHINQKIDVNHVYLINLIIHSKSSKDLISIFPHQKLLAIEFQIAKANKKFHFNTLHSHFNLKTLNLEY